MTDENVSHRGSQNLLKGIVKENAKNRLFFDVKVLFHQFFQGNTIKMSKTRFAARRKRRRAPKKKPRKKRVKVKKEKNRKMRVKEEIVQPAKIEKKKREFTNWNKGEPLKLMTKARKSFDSGILKLEVEKSVNNWDDKVFGCSLTLALLL